MKMKNMLAKNDPTETMKAETSCEENNYGHRTKKATNNR